MLPKHLVSRPPVATTLGHTPLPLIPPAPDTIELGVTINEYDWFRTAGGTRR